MSSPHYNNIFTYHYPSLYTIPLAFAVGVYLLLCTIVALILTCATLTLFARSLLFYVTSRMFSPHETSTGFLLFSGSNLLPLDGSGISQKSGFEMPCLIHNFLNTPVATWENEIIVLHNYAFLWFLATFNSMLFISWISLAKYEEINKNEFHLPIWKKLLFWFYGSCCSLEILTNDRAWQ